MAYLKAKIQSIELSNIFQIVRYIREWSKEKDTSKSSGNIDDDIVEKIMYLNVDKWKILY